MTESITKTLECVWSLKGRKVHIQCLYRCTVTHTVTYTKNGHKMKFLVSLATTGTAVQLLLFNQLVKLLIQV